MDGEAVSLTPRLKSKVGADEFHEAAEMKKDMVWVPIFTFRNTCKSAP